MEKHIKETRKVTALLFKESNKAKHLFNIIIPDVLLNHCYDNLRIHNNNWKRKLENKISALIEKSDWNNDIINENIINLYNR